MIKLDIDIFELLCVYTFYKCDYIYVDKVLVYQNINTTNFNKT